MNQYNAQQVMTNEEFWLRSHSIARYSFRPDGKVDVYGGVYIYEPNDFPGGAYADHRRKDTKLGVRFGQVGKSFDISRTTIASLEGFPEVITGDLCTHYSRIHSFSGIHKIIKQVRQVSINADATHLLGFILIPGIKRLDCNNVPLDTIINKYIKLGTKDVISCQDELIDAGFIEQAKL